MEKSTCTRGGVAQVTDEWGGIGSAQSGRGASCRGLVRRDARVFFFKVQDRKTFIVALTSSRQTGHSLPTNWPTQWLHMVWPHGTHAVSLSLSRQQGHSFVLGGAQG